MDLFHSLSTIALATHQMTTTITDEMASAITDILAAIRHPSVDFILIVLASFSHHWHTCLVRSHICTPRAGLEDAEVFEEIQRKEAKARRKAEDEANRIYEVDEGIRIAFALLGAQMPQVRDGSTAQLLPLSRQDVLTLRGIKAN